MIAKLLSLKYHSSIAIASFESGEDRFVLYGDRRMTAILDEYVGEEIILFITDESNWSWKNLEENWVEGEKSKDTDLLIEE